MKYEGKYKDMAEEFRKDGADEYTVEKFIRQEMEREDFEKLSGTFDFEACKEWKSWPEERRKLYLNNAYCHNCGVTSFALGYNIRKDKIGIVVEGVCKKCGEKIVRCCD